MKACDYHYLICLRAGLPLPPCPSPRLPERSGHPANSCSEALPGKHLRPPGEDSWQVACQSLHLYGPIGEQVQIPSSPPSLFKKALACKKGLPESWQLFGFRNLSCVAFIFKAKPCHVSLILWSKVAGKGFSNPEATFHLDSKCSPVVPKHKTKTQLRSCPAKVAYRV